MKQSSSVFISYDSQDKFELARLNDQIFSSMNRLTSLSKLTDNRLGVYYRKLTNYWLELDKCKHERAALDLRLETPPDYWPQVFYAFDCDQQKRLNRRQIVLEQLVDLGVKLVTTGSDEHLEFKFQTLESELDAVFVCLDGIDYYFPPVSAKDLHIEVTKFLRKKIKENVKLLRKNARILIKKIRSGFIPDLRQRFRALMRFLFKNLDDCSDHHEVLTRLQPLCIIKTIHLFHER
jgi:hypothetical protein